MQTTTDAKNYFLVNSLYLLRDEVSQQVAAVLAVLNELLNHAMYWDNEQSGKRVTTLEADSSERIEVLKRTLLEDLETGGTRKGTDV